MRNNWRNSIDSRQHQTYRMSGDTQICWGDAAIIVEICVGIESRGSGALVQCRHYDMNIGQINNSIVCGIALKYIDPKNCLTASASISGRQHSVQRVSNLAIKRIARLIRNAVIKNDCHSVLANWTVKLNREYI